MEPHEVFSCSHEKASVGLYEWDVECTVRGELKRFWVHLAVNKYGKTHFGKNAYEVLYWVTHASSTSHRHSSTSLWIHNSEETNKMNRLISSLGIEEDQASLRLSVVF
ncbi:hypothetical protein EBT16_07385 [bacterium]|nr:hypothetical protein [bacterium]